MKINNNLPLVFFSLVSLMSFSFLASANTGSYFTYHHDINVAIEEQDYKKAKSLIESLIPILDADIAFTKDAIAEEDDGYMTNRLTSKVDRQEEIREILVGFLAAKKKNLKEIDSIDVIRELRRLSIMPKDR